MKCEQEDVSAFIRIIKLSEKSLEWLVTTKYCLHLEGEWEANEKETENNACHRVDVVVMSAALSLVSRLFFSVVRR